MQKIKKGNLPVDVLFTGLLRTPERFKQSILDLTQMRDEGLVDNIIFSTWDYEVEKHKEIMNFLNENHVKVLGNKEPKERGEGNIWCQMKSMDEGLKKIDENKFILKNRTDIYINPNFLRKLFTEKENLLKITKNLPKGNLFKYKVWIHYFELKIPFMMGEECLFGHHHDLRLLINFDRSYDEKYKIGNAVSHIRRFIHPFLKDYPILYDYLKTYSRDTLLKTLTLKFSKHVFNIRSLKIARKVSSSNKFAHLEKQLRDDKFLDILSAYYSILYSHFYVDGNSFPDQVVNVEFRPESKPGLKLDSHDFKKSITTSTHQLRKGQVYLYDSDLLGNICKNNLKEDELSIRLAKAIDKFNFNK